jgi:hypothetical protein
MTETPPTACEALSLFLFYFEILPSVEIVGELSRIVSGTSHIVNGGISHIPSDLETSAASFGVMAPRACDSTLQIREEQVPGIAELHKGRFRL